MRPRALLVLAALALSLAGCRGGSYKTAPVSGRVLLDGKPLPDALVMFVPVTAPGNKDDLPSSFATTGPDGRYSLKLQSGSQSAGAVVGKHKVIITLGAGGGGSSDAQPTYHKQLPGRYNRKTELACEVPDSGRDDADFELQSN
jgi:hypothetical protein